MTDIADCRTQALTYLTRREHTQQELQTKLLGKKFAESIIESVIEQLLSQNLLSDARYAEQYTAERMRKGYGPMRIQQELQQRGVNAELVEQTLSVYKAEWLDHATLAWKKYMRLHPDVETVKQQQFLYQRGFTFDQIREVID